MRLEPKGQFEVRRAGSHVFQCKIEGLASYCKAETTFTVYFTILQLSRAFLSINNREMKSESGFSFAMASQPF